ncbi:hypothetical protein [Streptomyces similanensis]|uniref:Transmembrane protein n=1 Tax=Streptomyces similanensis TaxID=1274988 RepID=A0ABP9KFS3_9ACTN
MTLPDTPGQLIIAAGCCAIASLLCLLGAVLAAALERRTTPPRYRRLTWRYLAHRTGLVLSLSLLFTGVLFSNRWHRARILARKERL